MSRTSPERTGGAPLAGKARRALGFRARNPAKTRETILKAAIREFGEHGFKGARVEQIARRAGANMRMLYHYFGNKEKLYIRVLERVYERVRLEEQKVDLKHLDPVEGMRSLVDFTFRHFAENPELVDLVMGENLLRARYIKHSEVVPTMARPLQESLRELLGRAERTGVFRTGVDPVQLWLTIFSLCWVHLSNRHTLSWMFQADLADPAWLDARREHVKDVVVAYLAAPGAGAAAKRRRGG